MKNALQIDVNLWIDHGEALEELFIAWTKGLQTAAVQAPSFLQ